jgi:hypothetical protein
VNFAHRFAFDPASSGVARGGALLGLDGFSLSSFGLGYGVTDRLSVSVYREPTFICHPIQMMSAYRFREESESRPFDAPVRVSTEGPDDFESRSPALQKSYPKRAILFGADSLP